MKPQKNPIHMNADKNKISDLVILPGDPLRAKYIAENFLENYELVTSVRNMLGYTGYYKGKLVTVMSSGMGIPSAEIYTFELLYYYNVKKIIRIGTCGAVSKSLDLLDIVLADTIYTESNFSLQQFGKDEHIIKSSSSLNERIIKTAEDLNVKINVGTINTTLVFGPYAEADMMYERLPKDLDILAEEMEGFAVCSLAKSMDREATVILSIVDSPYTERVISVEDREKSLNDMIKIALESIIK